MSNTSMFAGLGTKELGDLLVVLYSEDGSESYTYSLASIDSIMSSRMVSSIHSAVRIGVSVVLGVILALVSRTYRSPLFIIYELNFFFMFLGSALELGWLFSFNASITEFLTAGDIPESSLSLSVAASAFLTILIMSLLASLVLQIYFACTDLYRSHQITITIVAAIGCFPTYLIWIWRLVLVAIQDLGPNSGGGDGEYGYGGDYWVFYGAWPSFAASTSFCSLILCIKLIKVQRYRTRMGMEAFNPIKILLTMALQNSALPAVLALVSAGINQDNFGGQSVAATAVPMTAVLLPVGYIWAQYTGNEANKMQSQQQRHVPHRNTMASSTKEKEEDINISEKTYHLDELPSPVSPTSARTLISGNGNLDLV